MRSRPPRGVLLLLTAGLLALGTLPPAVAVSQDHGTRVVSADPSDLTPHAMDGAVIAITRVGDRIIAAGSFTRVSPAGTYGNTGDDVDRHGLFAFDAHTGAIDPTFDPDLGGQARSLDTDGTHVYVGGSFTSVGGNDAIRRVVKLTAAGAVAPGFRVVPNAEVTEVVVRGSRLYIGGFFTKVTTPSGTSTRRALAALDPGNGRVRADLDIPFTGIYDPSTVDHGGMPSIKRFDVSADGSRLAVVGNFARVGGKPRAQIAVLDTARTPVTVDRWSTNRFDRSHNDCHVVFNTFTRDVDFSPNGSYFVVSTTGAFSGGAASGTMCDTVSRWQTHSSGNNPVWRDYTGGDTTYGVAATGSAVYVGGHMRWQNNPWQADQAGPGAVPRAGIAALDPVNGLPLSWNPGRTLGVGAQALFATSQGLWVGSDTTRIGSETRGRLALMPLAGGTTVPASPRATLPNDLFAAVPRGTGGILQRRPVRTNGTRAGRRSPADTSMNWASVRGGFLLGGTLYYGRGDGSFHKRAFDPRTGALGGQHRVDLHPDPDTGGRIGFPIARVSGMFFDPATHRLYYTVRGKRPLFYRYFTPESDVVGAQAFVAGTNGVNLANARGLTLASGRIYYGSQSGRSLRRVRFARGRVRSKPAVVSRDRGWNVRAILTPTS